MNSLSRRDVLRSTSLAGVAWLAGPRSGPAQDDPQPPQTFTYKMAGDCAIQADVYRAGEGQPRPVVVWIHGGALIGGHRGGIDRGLLAALRKAGCTVVSIDYRLAPETKLPAIIEDVRDAVNWVRQRGPELFGINPDRLAVAGGSAGGYLTLMTGFHVEPRPRALVSYNGYGDIIGPWYSRPDPFYRRSPLVTEEAARRVVGHEPIVNAAGKNERFQFYLYCRQNGLWPKEVAGMDPDKDPKAFDPYCPVRNVTPEYPPTMLIHGTADTDVPYEQSVLMDRELARNGVEHELITAKDGAHGLGNLDREARAAITNKAAAFLQQHLGA